MSAILTEQIQQEISALRQLMETHRGDRSTLDIDALARKVVELQRAQEPAPELAEGELIGAGPGPASPTILRGKFAGQSLDDVVFVHNFLNKTRKFEPMKVRAPSTELSGLVTRALSATGSGTGDELVPTGMAAQMWSDAFLASKVVSALGRIPMPTDPFDMPLTWGALTWRKGVQNQQTTPQDPATAKSTLTATEQVVEIDWAYDLDEDAVLAVLPTLRQELARSAAEQMDAFALNADATATATGNINLDDDSPASDSYYLTLGQDGVRHFYLVDNTGQSTDVNTTLTDALLRAGIGRLGKYGAMVDRLVMFTNPKTFVLSMLGLSNVVTVDKFGPRATVLTGQLGSYGGIAVVPSESMPLAEDDGKVCKTAGSNDEGQIAIVHRDMWRVGFRRELLIEVDKDIKKRQFVMVVSFREALAARGTRSSATHTAGIHGITYA